MSFDFNKLPDHLILDIFKKVRANDLPCIRLVCRRWAEIVSTSIVLRRKHQLAVTDTIVNDEHKLIQTFMHSRYNICANIKFKNVVIEESEVVAKLWRKIGPNIECLHMEAWNTSGMRIQLYEHNWITLLKKTPNLIELDINSSINESNDSIYSASDEVANEFNLKKLKIVNVNTRDTSLNQYMMKILIKRANKLTALRFSLYSEIEFNTMYFLIESQRHTLKLLELDGILLKKNWLKYLSIDNLSLEVVKLNSITKLDSELLELLANHKNLRELTSHVDVSENYKQYSAYLSKLEKLELTINIHSSDVIYPFPKNLNNLKSFTIHTNFNRGILIIAFETPTHCPTLQVLKMHSDSPVEISPVSLQSFIDNYPNLRVLKLGDYICRPQSVAAIADKLLLLEKLKLTVLVPNSKIEKNHPFPKKLDNLKSLKMHIKLHQDERNFTISFEIPTFRPMLEVFEITTYEEMRISPVSLQRFVDNFPNLRVLKLSEINTDAQSVATITEKLVHLEHLELHIRVTNSKIDRNAFSTISNLKKLKHLSVVNFIHICVDRFFIKHLRLPALTYLTLFSGIRAKYVTYRGIAGLVENCPLLERILLSKFKKIKKASFRAFFKRLVNLKEYAINA